MKRWVLVPVLALGFLAGVVSCGNPPESSDSDEPIFDDPEKYVAYGKGFMRNDKPNFRRAAIQFRRALEMDSDNFEAMLGLANAHGYRALALFQSDPKKNEKKIEKFVKKSADGFRKAHEIKPESAAPYKEWGKMLYELRNYNPRFLNLAIGKLKQGVKKSKKQEKPIVEALCYFYLGAVHRALANRGEDETKNLKRARDYLIKYLDTYGKEKDKIPKEQDIEDSLMMIEDRLEKRK